MSASTHGVWMSAAAVGMPLLQASVDRTDCRTDTEDRQQGQRSGNAWSRREEAEPTYGPTEGKGADGKWSTVTASGGRPYVIS